MTESLKHLLFFQEGFNQTVWDGNTTKWSVKLMAATTRKTFGSYGSKCFFSSRSGFPYQESTKVGVLLYLKPLILEWCVKLWESFDQKNRWWWPKFLFISMPRFPYVRDGFTKGIKKQQLVLLVRGRVEYGLYIVFLCEHVLQKNEHVWFQL